MTTHTHRVLGLRLRGTENYAREDDAGDLAWGPLGASTLFFDPDEDEERRFAHMSGAPGGHEAVVVVEFERTLRVLEEPELAA